MLDFLLEDRGKLMNLLVGQSLGIPHAEFSQEVMLVRCHEGSHDSQPTKVGTISHLISTNHRKILSTVFLLNLVAKETGVLLSSLALQEDFSRSIDGNSRLREPQKIADIGIFTRTESLLVLT